MQTPASYSTIKSLLFVSVMAATLSFGAPSHFASADSTTIDFEGYALGNPNSQDGWVFTGAYDAAIANNTSGSASLGAKSLRISNAATSGSFGDWVFSKPLVDESGETSAANDGLSGGTRQPYFETQFDIASAVPNAEQPGLQFSTSADRGDGARMTFLRFNDTPAGLQVTFADYQQSANNFVTTIIAGGLDRFVPHRIHMTVQFIDGVANDIVKVYIDGSLVHTGTTWEDYFRDEEGNPTRTIDSMLFQARSGAGTAPATLGYGFLIDNMTLFSGPAPISCSTVCYVDAVNGNDSNDGTTPATALKNIQTAIDTVQPNGTVRVLPGNYSETATNRFVLGANGPHQFGLFIPQSKAGISIIGVDDTDTPIATAAGTLANITTNATNNFGYSGIFVEADNVTIAGLKILNNTAGDNKTLEIIGDAFTMKDTWIAVPNGGAVYFGDWQYDIGTNTSHIQSYTLEENLFDQGTQVAISNGAGYPSPVTNRSIVNNTFAPAAGQNWPGISFNGAGGVAWYVYPVGGAVITGNTFSGSTQYIRARGDYLNAQLDWTSYWNDNTFDKAVVALIGAYPPFDVRTFSYSTFTNVRRIGAVIQPEVDNAQAGDTVLVKAGTYVEQVVVTKTLLLKGESGAGTTFIKAPATLPFASNPDSTIVKIAGAGVDAELTGFTVAGPGPGSCGSILAGIFVRDGANANIHDNQVLDIRDNEPSGDAPFSGCQNGVGIIVGRQQIGTTGTATIKNNTVAGYQKNGIVVSNVGSSAMIDGNTVAGFGAQSKIAQNGVQVSYGATATVQNNTIKDHLCNHSSCGPDPINQTQSGGVLLFLAGDGTIVKNNTVQNNDMGVYASGGQLEVKENFITANRYAGVYVDESKTALTANEITGASNIGVVIVSFNGAAANSEATLTNNLIKDAVEGVKLVDENASDTALPVLSAGLNSIAGGTNGLNNTVTGPANAEQNWWGSSTGPTNAGNPGGSGAVVAGNADFIPWLCDGTDTSTAIGFQPNVTQCGPATKLMFTTQPSNGTVGVALPAQPIVNAYDDYNNVVASFTGQVSLAFGTNPSGATLTASPVNAVAGVATFSGVSVNKAGTGYTLAASSPGLTSATSNAFNIVYACTTSGFQQPINMDSSSNFKRGSTIPVKVRVLCSGAPASNLTIVVSLREIGIPAGDVNEVESSSAADSGNTMRSTGAGQYMFNLSTKRSQFNAGQDLVAGKYELTVTSSANLFAPITVKFDLRK